MAASLAAPHQFQNRDEELVALAHRAKLALELREELPLKGIPDNPIASRAGTRLHSSPDIMRCFPKV